MTVADLLTSIKNIEPFPTVATRVLQLSGQPDLVPNDLMDVVRADPGIMSKVLKLANSSFYGCQRRIETLTDAGNLLGVKTIVSLVTSSCASSRMKDKGGGGQLWERCLTNAVAARIVAQIHEKIDPERAFTAGLLQDIGELVADSQEDGERIAIGAIVASGRTELEAEKEVLGLTHAEIGARLTSRWGLPEALVDTIRHHHAPEGATRDPILACTTHVAETIVAPLLGERPAYAVSDTALELLEVSRAQIEGLGDWLTEELDKAREALEG
ncbi:MAG: HDOD domain-containing protein [bacterium]|nr:HDOD domain-containing protein [bacterium]